jgi:S-adenosylmethionine hydrolase
MAGPLITFLSDFGHDDEFVGVCHAVIARRCPTARVLDISHGVAPQDVRAGALMLCAALPYLPAGVHLAVVDPGVGLEGASGQSAGRRAVALVTAGGERTLVGPDNGLLWPAAEQLGGVVRAVDVSRSSERLDPVSATFHGRDIFAPVAAALACGLAPEEVGERIDEHGLTRIALSHAFARDGALHARVLVVDRYGNLTLDATRDQLAEIGVRAEGEVAVCLARDTASPQSAQAPASARYASTFGEVPPGAIVLHEDSRRMLSLAVNRGSAAALLRAAPGDELLLRPR